MPLHLVAAIRGGVEGAESVAHEAVEFSVLHTLERWAVTPPWGPAESQVDLHRSGDEVIRAWAHVHLLDADDEDVTDVPISGLLRTMWDGLELYVSLSLFGVDVIAPLRRVSKRTIDRVLQSEVRGKFRLTGNVTPAVVFGAEAWNSERARSWNIDKARSELGRFAEVTDIDGAIAPSDLHQTPEGHPFRAMDEAPLAVSALLPTGTIDDIAWLVEAVCAALKKAGVEDDVQISVRLRR